MNADTRTAYEKNKPNIYKWRENNKEKYNASSNKAQAIYYVKNKERISQPPPMFCGQSANIMKMILA